MNQHYYQAARLRPFEDKSIHKVWVHPKDGSSAFPRPVSQLAAAQNFQTPEIERFQEKTEAKAGRAFQNPGELSKRERDAVAEWIALHIIRSKRSYSEIFPSSEEYNRFFFEEFEKEVLITRKFTLYPPIAAIGGRFFITSDEPIVEFRGALEHKEIARGFAKSPEILIMFGLQPALPEFPLPVEDHFNAMVFANTGEFVYSHRKDVSLSNLKDIAKKYGMIPTRQSITFEGKLSSGDVEHLSAIRGRKAN